MTKDSRQFSEPLSFPATEVFYRKGMTKTVWMLFLRWKIRGHRSFLVLPIYGGTVEHPPSG